MCVCVWHLPHISVWLQLQPELTIAAADWLLFSSSVQRIGSNASHKTGQAMQASEACILIANFGVVRQGPGGKREAVQVKEVCE